MKISVSKKSASIPPGEYQSIIKDISLTKNFKRDIIEFLFEVVEGPYSGTALRGFCNGSTVEISSHSKLYRWYQCATGDELEDGHELNTDDFLNKVLTVDVKTKISKKTKNSFSNVTDILGVRYEL